MGRTVRIANMIVVGSVLMWSIGCGGSVGEMRLTGEEAVRGVRREQGGVEAGYRNEGSRRVDEGGEFRRMSAVCDRWLRCEQ